jgi:hypothetical protein
MRLYDLIAKSGAVAWVDTESAFTETGPIEDEIFSESFGTRELRKAEV